MKNGPFTNVNEISFTVGMFDLGSQSVNGQWLETKTRPRRNWFVRWKTFLVSLYHSVQTWSEKTTFLRLSSPYGRKDMRALVFRSREIVAQIVREYKFFQRWTLRKLMTWRRVARLTYAACVAVGELIASCALSHIFFYQKRSSRPLIFRFVSLTAETAVSGAYQSFQFSSYACTDVLVDVDHFSHSNKYYRYIFIIHLSRYHIFIAKPSTRTIYFVRRVFSHTTFGSILFLT